MRTLASPCIHIHRCASIRMEPSPNVKVCYNPGGGGVEEEALLATIATGRSFLLDADLVVGRTGGSVMAGQWEEFVVRLRAQFDSQSH